MPLAALCDDELYVMTRYLDGEEVRAFRGTSKRHDLLARHGSTLATCISMTRTCPWDTMIPVPRMQWSKFCALGRVFGFEELRYLEISNAQIAFPFGEHADRSPETGIRELRLLLDDHPRLRLVVHAGASATRCADKLQGIAGWKACDRWRFSMTRVRNPHPRVVAKVWHAHEPLCASIDWLQYILTDFMDEYLAGWSVMEETRIEVGRYSRLSVLVVHHDWQGLEGWLEASETPSLRRVYIGQYTNIWEAQKVGTIIQEDIKIFYPKRRANIDALIRVIQKKFAIALV